MKLKALGRKIRQEKKIKVIQVGKEVRLSLFANEMFYIRDYRNSIRILVDIFIFHPFSNLTECKIRLQNLATFLYINNKYKEKDITGSPLFYHSPRENKI